MRRLRVSPLVWGMILAPGALLLGYLGYRSIAGPTTSQTDMLFRALQLFALEGNVPSQGTPWQLDVARFLAPFALVYGAVLALLTLLRDQVNRTLVVLLAREHVVLVGLSRRNSLLASSLRQSGWRVVVVEADPNQARIPGVRATGAQLIFGDATQPVILRRAQVARARHVIIAIGDDSYNLEVAEQVRRLANQEPGTRPTTVHVAIASHNLWAELERLQLAQQQEGVVLQFFNLPDLDARALLNEAQRLTGHAFFASSLVDGGGEVAQRAMVHLVRRSIIAGIRPRLHMTADTYARVLEPLRGQEPWLAGAADLVITSTDALAGGDHPSVAFLCEEGSDASSIASALSLSRSALQPTVFVSVHGSQSDALLEAVGVAGNIHLVATADQAVTHDFLRQSGLELMARVRHEDYVAQEMARGVSAETNSSVVPWDQLPESLKESNRRFAEAVGEVLHQAGARLVPLQRREAEREFTDPETLERLAINEHDRWMRALLLDGWRHSTGPKDPRRKTHPLLVPWADLEEVEREKDRDAIRAIPRMLARVGYTVEVPTKQHAEPPDPGPPPHETPWQTQRAKDEHEQPDHD